MSFVTSVAVVAVLIGVEILAAWANRRMAARGTAPAAWRLAYRWRWILGVPLAIVSMRFAYTDASGGEVFTIHGFPLLVVAFDESGRDYVHGLALPSALVNAAVWYFLPGVALWLSALPMGGRD